MNTDRFEKRKLVTKEAVQQAFVDLLNEKPYDDITVREIAQRANVGFKTFYRHYQDKVELTQAIMQGFVEQVYADFQPMTTLEASLNNLRRVLEIIEANASTVRAIGRTPLRDTLVQPVTQSAFVEGLNIHAAVLGDAGSDAQSQRELIGHHFAQSQLIFFFWWVENDMKMPIDGMLEMIAELIIKPIWKLKTK
ncbi:MAG: TetR/AcrR family transcriptional regulator [Deinococcota bacterium]